MTSVFGKSAVTSWDLVSSIVAVWRVVFSVRDCRHFVLPAPLSPPPPAATTFTRSTNLPSPQSRPFVRWPAAPRNMQGCNWRFPPHRDVSQWPVILHSAEPRPFFWSSNLSFLLTGSATLPVRVRMQAPSSTCCRTPRKYTVVIGLGLSNCCTRSTWRRRV